MQKPEFCLYYKFASFLPRADQFLTHETKDPDHVSLDPVCTKDFEKLD